MAAHVRVQNTSLLPYSRKSVRKVALRVARKRRTNDRPTLALHPATSARPCRPAARRRQDPARRQVAVVQHAHRARVLGRRRRPKPEVGTRQRPLLRARGAARRRGRADRGETERRAYRLQPRPIADPVGGPDARRRPVGRPPVRRRLRRPQGRRRVGVVRVRPASGRGVGVVSTRGALASRKRAPGTRPMP